MSDELNLLPDPPDASIDLYWLPLGAGGWFVRFNGRVRTRPSRRIVSTGTRSTSTTQPSW